MIDGLGKVLTWPDVLDVHEDAVDADQGAKVIGNAAGIGGRIVAPIIDEDVVRGGGPCEEILDQPWCSSIIWRPCVQTRPRLLFGPQGGCRSRCTDRTVETETERAISFVPGTFIVFEVVNAIRSMRPSQEAELEGLDMPEFGMLAYPEDEGIPAM
ncbi:MAG: hypothetical protein ABJA98_30260 [Acidobacteriota bacterium]